MNPSWPVRRAGVCVCANFAPKLSVDLYQQTAVEKDYDARLE